MLTLSYADLDNKVFLQALEKIDAMPGQEMNSKTLWDFNRLKSGIDSELKLFIKCFRELHDTHCEKNEDGTIIFGDDKRPVFKDLEAFGKDMDKLHAQTFDVHCALLDRDELMRSGMSVKEVRACAHIMNPSIREVKDE